MVDMYQNWRPIFNDSPDRHQTLRVVLTDENEYPDECLVSNEAFQEHVRSKFPWRNFRNEHAIPEYPHHSIVGFRLVLPYNMGVLNG